MPPEAAGESIMKRIIALALTLLCVLPAIVSCKDNTPPSDGTSDAETTTTELTEEIEPIVLGKGSEAYYNVVRPDNESESLIEIMKDIILVVQQKSGGMRLKPDVDWIKPGSDASAAKEILVGYTCREETKQVMDSIGYDDFAIRVVGNKIVIAAHRKERLIQAYKYFVNELLEFRSSEEGGMSVVLTENYHMKSEKTFVIDENNPLSGYSIVCDKNDSNCYKAAKELSAAIKKFSDVELPVKGLYDDETECEIIVGMTDREASKKIFEDKSVTRLDYVIGSVGKKIVIGSESDFMTGVCIDSFCEKYLDDDYSYTFNVVLDDKEINSTYRFDEDATLAEGADIRVMSYNILSEEWAAEAKVLDGRDTGSVATIFYFSPDVVGLQEVSANWYKRLDNLFGDKYKIVDKKNTLNQTNYSPLAYNAEKVKVVEHGVKEYSKGNSKKLRLMSWALFEKLDSGKRFVVINTHWDLGSNDDKGYRDTHSKEMAAFAIELEKKYDCPIITTGDYNANESSSMYKNFVETTEFHEAKYTAKVINRACKTYHALGTPVSTAKAESIDHIFGSGKVEFLYYDVLINNIVTNASDHNPIYADIKLK